MTAPKQLTVGQCDYCAKAKAIPDFPMYRAQCVGCAVRALAQGPQYHRSGLDGYLAKGYREALASIFGDRWREGHAQVRAEHERIKAARAML